MESVFLCDVKEERPKKVVGGKVGDDSTNFNLVCLVITYFTSVTSNKCV